MRIGGIYSGNDTGEFVVWAPQASSISLRILSPSTPHLIPLNKDDSGYWHARIDRISPGTRYLYVIDDQRERPDPASNYQPEGVHRPSAIVDHSAFAWTDQAWRGIDLAQYIIYELHVGTFTPEGTFEAVIPRLADLKETGITALEIMPVAQFPGVRNWGYDGAYPYAVQNSYGGPDGLKKLVDACHAEGLAVILDVVYNHFGPEGSYFRDFAPYYTAKYRTPWGDAINFDDEHNDGVRNYFVENALHWFEHYHFDALRLDAVHGIFDFSARPFLLELAEQVDLYSRAKRRKHYLIAESDLNDSRLVRERACHGFGLDAQWIDDFHHSVHTLLTEESRGYYRDFGGVEDLARSFVSAYVYTGQRSVYRRKPFGSPTTGIPADRFVVFSQNHDQVGNRMRGERLARLVDHESLKLAAAAVLLSPFIPLLFMGEEYGETAPFLYFVSHGDPALVEAVRKGRREEFREFFHGAASIPDPEGEESFERSKLRWESRREDRHRVLHAFYRRLVELRRTLPALSPFRNDATSAVGSDRLRQLLVERGAFPDRALILFNFSDARSPFAYPLPGDRWRNVLDSSDAAWGGPGGTAAAAVSRDLPPILQPKSVLLLEEDHG